MSALLLLRTRPAYRRLCAAVAVSQTGDWLLLIALPLAVLRLSGSALDTANVFLAEIVPAVVVGTLGGPLIDRLPARPLLAGLSALQAPLLVPLLWLGPGNLWLVYLVCALQAAVTSLTAPGLQALVPAVVAGEETATANATTEMVANVARLIGSPLGGVLLPLLGLRLLVLADAVSFVGAALLLAAAGRHCDARVAAPGGTGGVHAVLEGWRAIRRAVTLRSALAISFLSAVAQGMFLVLFVLFVLRTLHAGDGGVGLLRGVQAIGGVLGGVVVGLWAGRAGARVLAVSGLAAFGLISLIVWNSPALTTAMGWYAALFVLVGVPATALVTGLITGAQAACPRPVRGRVLSLLAVADALGQGTGVLLAGMLAGRLALGPLLDVQAGCYLTCALIATTTFARPAPGRATPSPAGWS